MKNKRGQIQTTPQPMAQKPTAQPIVQQPTAQPVAQQVSTPKKKSRWWIWLIVILIIAAIGIGVFFLVTSGDSSYAIDAGTSAANSVPQPPALPN
jgi:hypothetical protein